MSSDKTTERPVVYLISPNHWGKMKLSKHHYATALSKMGYKVFFISPPSLTAKLFMKEEINENLTVVSYYPIFRLKSILPVAIFNWLIKLQIAFLVKMIGEKPELLWSFSTTLYLHLGWFKASKTIFHPVDQLNTKEAQTIAAESDLILSCSRYILDEVRCNTVPKYYISHGLADSYVKYNFSPWKRTKLPLQAAYVGNLFMRNLDRAIFLKVIQKYEQVNFHFFGADRPQDSNVSAWVRDESIAFVESLRSFDNVVLHGAVEPSALPKLLDSMDLFMLCYEPDEDNVISNSHKILEYLSTGRPIVSSYVEEYEGSELILMCDKSNNDSYIDQFDECLQNIESYNSPDLQKERKDFALANSYNNKVIEIESLLKNQMNAK